MSGRAGLPDAYAPDWGDDAGSVIIGGDAYPPDEVRDYARELLRLADFADEVKS